MVSVCTTCKGLQKHLKTLDGAAQDATSTSLPWVNATLPSLRHSANSGCRACGLLLQGILLHHDRFSGAKEETVKITAESFQIPKSSDRSDAHDHLSVEVRWKQSDDDCCDDDNAEHDHDEGYPDLKLEFYTDHNGQSPFSAIGPGRHISDNPLQDAGLSTARDMIKKCLSTHTKCRHPAPTSLPRRVLDVLSEDGSKGIRLHESDFNQDERRYEFGEFLTLSHCWGSGRNVLKTTTKTIQSHKKSIPWASLPRTFQDAVNLTRALGFRWLWIDSLCILQDDAPEKLAAASNMDKIFSNSFLTIAATSTADTKDGLFPPKQQPYKIQATDSKGSVSKIYIREQPSHYSFKAPFDEGVHMNDWELPFNPSTEANAQTPLLKRAWAYAERLLSPRVLHFTKSEMILECRESYQCECGRVDNSTFDSRTTDSVKQEFAKCFPQAGSPGGMANSDGNVNRNDRVDSLTSQLATTTLSDTDKALVERRGQAMQLWSYIITEYTARDLTYDEDRLVAILGVAKSLSDILQSGYVAGQWTFSTLGLLWYPSDGSKCRRSRATSNNIPSWSWASVEGSPIFFDNSTAMDLACRASFPSAAREPTWSPVSGNTLELTAALATEVEFLVEGTNDYVLVKNGISVDFRPDICPPRGDDSIASGETLICVLVSMTFRSSIIGLVLKQSKSNPDVYHRVGRFECYECQWDNNEIEPEDAEALFGHWFPAVEDMTQLDDGPKRTFIVV